VNSPTETLVIRPSERVLSLDKAGAVVLLLAASFLFLARFSEAVGWSVLAVAVLAAGLAFGVISLSRSRACLKLERGAVT
jgi:hypothetical protein